MFVHEPVSVCGAMCGVVTVCKNEPVFVHTECVGVNLSLCVYMFAHVHILCGSEPAWAGLLVPAPCCLLATESIPESRETSLLREPFPSSGKKALQRPDSTVPSGKAATPGLTQAASPSPQAPLSPHTAGPGASACGNPPRRSSQNPGDKTGSSLLIKEET